MIISCSRRTDIPAFYTHWLMNRLRAGYCTVVNPFNRNSVTRVPLDRKNVDIIVFWTKNPRSLIEHVEEINEFEIPYYFQFTVNGYGPVLEPSVPEVEAVIDTFEKLSRQIGPERVVWRYDPILLDREHTRAYHEDRFDFLAGRLQGHTKQVIVSIVDLYQKTIRNIQKHVPGYECEATPPEPELKLLLSRLSSIAKRRGLSIQSCAEDKDFTSAGVPPGKCIDDVLIHQLFGVRLSIGKDQGQRPACLCSASKDIGFYNTCQHFCRYCYATTSESTARTSFESHNPDSPSIIGWYEPTETAKVDSQQTLLFSTPPISGTRRK